jgi:hypothetical protein
VRARRDHLKGGAPSRGRGSKASSAAARAQHENADWRTRSIRTQLGMRRNRFCGASILLIINNIIALFAKKVKHKNAAPAFFQPSIQKRGALDWTGADRGLVHLPTKPV